MAKLRDIVEMWQGSQNLRATQKESRAQNKQMTAVENISDTQQIVEPSRSLFEHVRLGAFKFSQRSLCHQLRLQMTFLDDELNYSMSPK